jgi:hypothetical protein
MAGIREMSSSQIAAANQCLGKVRDPPFLCIRSHAILLLRHVGASLSWRVGNGPGCFRRYRAAVPLGGKLRVHDAAVLQMLIRF